MSSDWANFVVAIVIAAASWTGTVMAMTWFLSGKFRHLEGLIYRQINMEKSRVDRRLNDHSLRINRLEIRVHGWTHVEQEPEEKEED